MLVYLYACDSSFAQDTITNSPSETNAWTKAFMECLQFALKQIGSEPSCQDVGQAILLDQVLCLFSFGGYISRVPGQNGESQA